MLMKFKRNFLKQPAKGLDENSQGRTEEQIGAYEAKVGFKLPASYCELLRQQNGGNVRYQKITGIEDFSFNGGFVELRPELEHYITNFKDYILMTCSEEQLAETQVKLSPFYPERLVLFSGLDGHSAAYFDYGYRQQKPVTAPSIVFIDDDGDDFLHFREIGPKFDSFEAFIDSLQFDTEADDASYIGIVSNHDYDKTMQQLAQYLGLKLKNYADDERYGHFNFEQWHSAHVPLELDDKTMVQYAKENGTTLEKMQDWTVSEGKTRNIYSIFSPNQHRSGTYLYPDNPEITVVMEIKKSWFPMQKPIASFTAKLRQIPGITEVITLP
jgi:SMI1-KNR4 cell-wall